MRKQLNPAIKAEMDRLKGRQVIIAGGNLPERSPGPYRDGFLELAYKFSLLGATLPQLAHLFEVSEDTISTWLRHDDDFKMAVQAGREVADANVAKSLYRRAIGYSHPDVKIFYDADRGQVIQVPFTKYYPPDTGAASRWLSARQPEQWAMTAKIEASGPNGTPLAGPVIVINPVAPMETTIDGVADHL